MITIYIAIAILGFLTGLNLSASISLERKIISLERKISELKEQRFKDIITHCDDMIANCDSHIGIWEYLEKKEANFNTLVDILEKKLNIPIWKKETTQKEKPTTDV